MTNPLDERMHAVGGHAAWSESYYFNFVDPKSGVGMFTRMGFRPGDGWADGLHVVYLGGDRVAFTYGRRTIEADLGRYDGDLRAGDLELVCVVPFQNWEVRYDGHCQDVTDARVLMERRKARPEGWYRPASLRMHLDFDATSQPHYAAAGERGHFEQTGHVRGRIEVVGERSSESFQVDGFGVRDKSWGPRDWGVGGSDVRQLVLDELRRRPGAGRIVLPACRRLVGRRRLDPPRRPNRRPDQRADGERVRARLTVAHPSATDGANGER
jgi:hypothetical protein